MQYAYLIGMIWKCTFLKNTTERKFKLYFYQEKGGCSRLVMMKHMQIIQYESAFIKRTCILLLIHSHSHIDPQTTCIVLNSNPTLIYNNPSARFIFLAIADVPPPSSFVQ